VSVEGGIRGDQRRLVCSNCGKVFFAWHPDELPGQIKCYFCKYEFADEACLRIRSRAQSRSAAPPIPLPPSTPPPNQPCINAVVFIPRRNTANHTDCRRVQGFAFPRLNIGSATGWYRDERVEPRIQRELGLMTQRLFLSLAIDLAH
jgi:ribosomal protein S27AE